MVLEFFKGGSDQTLEQIEATIVEMLLINRHTFDLAINTVVGGTDPESVDKEVHKSDRRVNKAERRIRKELVVHTSVRGANTDLPRVLVAMSVIKDAERIGDYAKNIWDLAAGGVDLSGDDDADRWLALRDRTSKSIAESARIYQERDTDAAHGLVQEMDEWTSAFDACVDEMMASQGSARDAVSRALLCRYLKRITAHLMNVISSLVMPVHRRDYYDEKKSDRE